MTRLLADVFVLGFTCGAFVTLVVFALVWRIDDGKVSR